MSRVKLRMTVTEQKLRNHSHSRWTSSRDSRPHIHCQNRSGRLYLTWFPSYLRQRGIEHRTADAPLSHHLDRKCTTCPREWRRTKSQVPSPCSNPSWQHCTFNQQSHGSNSNHMQVHFNMRLQYLPELCRHAIVILASAVFNVCKNVIFVVNYGLH